MRRKFWFLGAAVLLLALVVAAGSMFARTTSNRAAAQRATALVAPVAVSVPALPGEPGEVQLVAVQMALDLGDHWTREAYERKIDEQMRLATAGLRDDLPTLVAFPEDVGLMLVAQGMEKRLGGIGSIETAIQTAVQSNVVPLAWLRVRHGVSWVPALLLHKNRSIAETYFETFAKAARKYGVYVVAGSVALPPYRVENGIVQWWRGPSRANVHNTSYLFGPDGRVVGWQDKVELIELEREAALDLTPGSLRSLRVFDTPVGKVGIAICLDAFQDSVVDLLAAQGAQILVQPSANPGPWDAWQQGDWLRSSHEKVAVDGRFSYALNPMLVGPLWDIAFFGQSSVVSRAATAAAPTAGYEEFGPAPGFLKVASSDHGEEVLAVTVPHPTKLE